jgi:pathogenesis-related protein 1
MYNNISVKIIMILVTTAILTVPSSVSQISYSQGDADFQNTILNIHDQERKAVNNPSLSWSDSLAADAQSWADHITTLGLGPDDLAPHAPFDITILKVRT